MLDAQYPMPVSACILHLASCILHLPHLASSSSILHLASCIFHLPSCIFARRASRCARVSRPPLCAGLPTPAVRGSPDPAQIPDRRSPTTFAVISNWGDLRSAVSARSGDLRRALFETCAERSSRPARRLRDLRRALSLVIGIWSLGFGHWDLVIGHSWIR